MRGPRSEFSGGGLTILGGGNKRTGSSSGRTSGDSSHYVGRKKVRRLRALDHPAAPSPVVDPRSAQISLREGMMLSFFMRGVFVFAATTFCAFAFGASAAVP